MSGAVLMAAEREMCSLPHQPQLKPEMASAVSVTEIYDDDDDCESSCSSQGCECRDVAMDMSDLSFEDFTESTFTKSYRKTTLESSYSASVKFAKMIELLASISVEAFSLKDFYEQVVVQQEEYKRKIRHLAACYHRERHAHRCCKGDLEKTKGNLDTAKGQIIILERDITVLKETHKEEITRIKETYEKTIKEIKETHEKELIMIKESHKVEITKNTEHFEKIIMEIKEKHEKELIVIKETFEKELIVIKETHEKELIMIKESHEKELIMIKESHKEKITEIKEFHEKEIILIKEKHETFIKELIEKHEKEILVIRESHSQEIVKIKESHEHSIIVIKEKHNTTIRELKETHEKYIRELRETHETVIKELKETHTKEIERTVINTQTEVRGSLDNDFDCERQELIRKRKEALDLWTASKKSKEESEKHYREEIKELKTLYRKENDESEKHYNEEIEQLKTLYRKEQEESEKHYNEEIEQLNELHKKEVTELEQQLLKSSSSNDHHIRHCCGNGSQSSSKSGSTTTTTVSKSSSSSSSSSTSVSISEYQSKLQFESDERVKVQKSLTESKQEKETLLIKVGQLEKDLAAAKNRMAALPAPQKPTHGKGKNFAIQWIMYHDRLIVEDVNINNTSFINIPFARDPPFKVSGNLWDAVAKHAAPGANGYHVDNKTLGCDPAPKKTKTMIVAYTVGESTQLRYAAAVEGDMLKLSAK